MKRINLSFYNNSLDAPQNQDAVLRVTYPAPQNLTGKLRASRFKISKGAFPLFFLGPDERIFTTDEKIELDTYGKTPTGVCWGYMNSITNTIPCTNNTYLLSDREPFVQPCVTTRANYSPANINYTHVYLSQSPQWKKVGENKWKLTNEAQPVFEWDDLEKNRSYFELVNYASSPSKIDLKESKNGLTISLTCIDNSTPRMTSTYVAFASSRFVDIIKTSNYAPFTLNQRIISVMGDPWLHNTNNFYVMDGEVQFSKQVESIIARNQYSASALDLSVSTYLDYNNSSGYLLYPYTAILVVIDELNFTGESIVVNSDDLNGVITPSILSTFKTYLIGMSDSQRSDFVIVDDKLNQAPLLVTAPSLSTLTVRLFMLTKQNKLFAMKIPSGEGFFIQITIEP